MEKKRTRRRSIDIIVGIPSFNEADNISFVAEQVDWGLRKYFPQYKSLIINVDNNSPDGTERAFLDTKTLNSKEYISTPEGVLGKGNNFHNLFKEIQKRRPKVCLVVDADLRSITPEWIKKMVDPIFEGYDYVLPLYSRNEYDGTITNNICYPLLYGVLGIDIRQPIAGDFSFSPDLCDHWLKQKWHESTYQYGIDIFMTMGAIFGDFKIGQVVLGSKIHKPSAPKLGTMFTQVVNTLFRNILKNKKFWLKKRQVFKPPIIFNGSFMSPQNLGVDYKTMKRIALDGWEEHRAYYQQIFPRPLYASVRRLFEKESISITTELWIDLLFATLTVYANSRNKIRVVEALKPLYFARTAYFIKTTLDLDYKQSEAKIVAQAKTCYKKRRKLTVKF